MSNWKHKRSGSGEKRSSRRKSSKRPLSKEMWNSERLSLQQVRRLEEAQAAGAAGSSLPAPCHTLLVCPQPAVNTTPIGREVRGTLPGRDISLPHLQLRLYNHQALAQILPGFLPSNGTSGDGADDSLECFWSAIYRSRLSIADVCGGSYHESRAVQIVSARESSISCYAKECCYCPWSALTHVR